MGFKPRAAFAADLARIRSAGVEWVRIGPVDSDSNVWRPTAPYLEIEGDLRCTGNIVVATGKHDFGTVVVSGDVSCRNLVVGSGFFLLCGGGIDASETIIATAADSGTYVAGPVKARLLDSGSGAWLKAYDSAQLEGSGLYGYAMVAGRPHSAASPVDLETVLRSDAIETEEWDSLDDDERIGETRAEYIRVADSAARRILGAGGSILR